MRQNQPVTTSVKSLSLLSFVLLSFFRVFRVFRGDPLLSDPEGIRTPVAAYSFWASPSQTSILVYHSRLPRPRDTFTVPWGRLLRLRFDARETATEVHVISTFNSRRQKARASSRSALSWMHNQKFNRTPGTNRLHQRSQVRSNFGSALLNASRLLQEVFSPSPQYKPTPRINSGSCLHCSHKERASARHRC